MKGGGTASLFSVISLAKDANHEHPTVPPRCLRSRALHVLTPGTPWRVPQSRTSAALCVRHEAARAAAGKKKEKRVEKRKSESERERERERERSSELPN